MKLDEITPKLPREANKLYREIIKQNNSKPADVGGVAKELAGKVGMPSARAMIGLAHRKYLEKQDNKVKK